MNAKRNIVDLAARVDIQINGTRPHDIQVHNDQFYGRILRYGSLGLGESYMDGWWDCKALDEALRRIIISDLGKHIRSNWRQLLAVALPYFMNLQSRRRRAFQVGIRHYDIGNDLYQKMLDERMVYTCAYWKDATNLDEAQEAKLDLVCRKIGLQPDQRVLDIGCGWGSFMRFAAEKYGVRCVGLTVSKKQVELGQQMCAGLPVEFCLEDYRSYQPDESFDHVVSLGMFEHVGVKNYRAFFEIARRLLKPKGLFLLHTIANNISHRVGDAWYAKYIFPNSIIPSLAQISQASERIFRIEDVHNFGSDYHRTLKAWYTNCKEAWPELEETGKYDERFWRMWRYYLLTSAASFQARSNQLLQIVCAPHGVPGEYRSVR